MNTGTSLHCRITCARIGSALEVHMISHLHVINHVLRNLFMRTMFILYVQHTWKDCVVKSGYLYQLVFYSPCTSYSIFISQTPALKPLVLQSCRCPSFFGGNIIEHHPVLIKLVYPRRGMPRPRPRRARWAAPGGIPRC